MIIRWERRNKGSRGNRRSVKKSAENIQKKYKKGIDKSEKVRYNGVKEKGKPSESIKKEAEKLPQYKL